MVSSFRLVQYRRDFRSYRPRKRLLLPAILAQLSGDSDPQNPPWSVRLTIIVVEDEEVRAFGYIADSADLDNRSQSIWDSPSSRDSRFWGGSR